jgi:hypothetical protein
MTSSNNETLSRNNSEKQQGVVKEQLNIGKQSQ